MHIAYSPSLKRDNYFLETELYLITLKRNSHKMIFVKLNKLLQALLNMERSAQLT